MSKNKEAESLQSVRAKNDLTLTPNSAITADSAPKNIVSPDKIIVNKNLSTVNQNTVARSDVAILRQAAADADQLNLTAKEKNSLEIFQGKMDRLDKIQNKIDAIYAKPSTKGFEGELARLEAQAKEITKSMWQISQYDLLKSVSDKARELMVQKYGAIESGEKASREANIPKQTSKDTKVSRTVRTAIEAAATTDEVAQELREKAVESEFYYIPISDAGAKARADETIRRKGWDDALSDWRAMSKAAERNSNALSVEDGVRI